MSEEQSFDDGGTEDFDGTADFDGTQDFETTEDLDGTSPSHVFDSPERFVVGTVGQPGDRAFFLQASGNGAVVTVALEKAEVSALAEGMVTLLESVGQTP